MKPPRQNPHLPMEAPGSAALQSGTRPAHEHKGWYQRRLPHFDASNIYQLITYRLADSLPASVLISLDRELQTMDPAKRSNERRRRIESYLDSGSGSCVLRDPDIAKIVIDAWLHFDRQRYELISWVVMPNHVHLLVRQFEGWPLAKVVQSWKSWTGRRIKLLGNSKSTEQILNRSGERRSQGLSRKARDFGRGGTGIGLFGMRGIFRGRWITFI